MPLGSNENQRRRLTARTEQVEEGGSRSLVGRLVSSSVGKNKGESWGRNEQDLREVSPV